MKIDLHVHSKEKSGCGQSTRVEQVKAAVVAGLDALVFTDHTGLCPADSLRELNHEFAPFRVFSGREVTTIEGEDIVVIGVQDRLLDDGRLLWTYPQLHSFVRDRDGFMILAHPFRYRGLVDIELAKLPPDGIEIHSVSTPLPLSADIRRLAVKHHMKLCCNSDGHIASVMGKYFNSIEGPVPKADRDLVEALRSGIFECGCPWAKDISDT